MVHHNDPDYEVLVVTPKIEDIGLETLERVMQQLKDAGYLVDEVDMPAPNVLEVFKKFDEQLKGARHEVAEQLTKMLQEIYPGVKVVFTDVETMLDGKEL